MVTVGNPQLRAVQEGGKNNGSVTLILVPFFRCLLFHASLYSLPNALFAFASLLSISLSILASDKMVQPR